MSRQSGSSRPSLLQPLPGCIASLSARPGDVVELVSEDAAQPWLRQRMPAQPVLLNRRPLPVVEAAAVDGADGAEEAYSPASTRCA